MKHYKTPANRIKESMIEFIKLGMLATALVMIIQVTEWPNPAGELAQSSSVFVLAHSPDEVKKENFNYEFTIKDLDGNKLSFKEFKGKTVFLNLWATWCGPCRAEMPGIQKLYDKVDKEKIIFVMLSIDKEGDQARVATYLRQRQFSFKAYMPSGQLPEQLKTMYIPVTYVISSSGKIIRKEVGAVDYDTPKFKEFLEELSEKGK